MQEHDNGAGGDGIIGSPPPEGEATPDIRLAQDPDERGENEDPKGVLPDPDNRDDSSARGDVPSDAGGSGGFGEPAETLEDQIFQVNQACVSEVKTFVRSGRSGLVHLKRVLPSIFQTFPFCNPSKVLSMCGLLPVPSENGSPFPTFYFRPDLHGARMIDPAENQTGKRKRGEPSNASSKDLVQAYDAVRCEWSSAMPVNS